METMVKAAEGILEPIWGSCYPQSLPLLYDPFCRLATEDTAARWL